MTFTTSVEEAVAAIDGHEGMPESFELAVAFDLTLNDNNIPFDVAMAAITDRILKRQWDLTGSRMSRAEESIGTNHGNDFRLLMGADVH